MTIEIIESPPFFQTPPPSPDHARAPDVAHRAPRRQQQVPILGVRRRDEHDLGLSNELLQWHTVGDFRRVGVMAEDSLRLQGEQLRSLKLRESRVSLLAALNVIPRMPMVLSRRS